MYKKNTNGTFSVQSRTNKDKFWTVSANMESCDCPKFKWILKGQPCHHIDEVKEGEQNPINLDGWNEKDYKEPLLENQFIEKYGEELLDKLLAAHEVIIHNKRVRLLN